MVKDGIKYGISFLPDNGNMAYRDGYRYGAYTKNLKNEETHITKFFKTIDEIDEFVKKNPEYGKKLNAV